MDFQLILAFKCSNLTLAIGVVAGIMREFHVFGQILILIVKDVFELFFAQLALHVLLLEVLDILILVEIEFLAEGAEGMEVNEIVVVIVFSLAQVILKFLMSINLLLRNQERTVTYT